MAKRNRAYQLTREKYKSIKKYDHQQLESFCEDVYRAGVEVGKASGPGVDVESIYKAVENTKGIGPKKYAELKANIEAVFTKEAAHAGQ